MAKIGNWGRYVKFSTSENKILNFENMQRKISIRTAKHNLINRKPRLEFVGADLDEVHFTMNIDASLCHKPKNVEQRLIRAALTGRVAPLVIGGRRILRQGIITQLTSAYNIVLKRGEIYSMSIDVTMTEYQ